MCGTAARKAEQWGTKNVMNHRKTNLLPLDVSTYGGEFYKTTFRDTHIPCSQFFRGEGSTKELAKVGFIGREVLCSKLHRFSRSMGFYVEPPSPFLEEVST